MKPFYQSGNVTIYHGDCRDIAPALPKASVDLIISDPPYGVRWRSGFRTLQFEEIANDDGSLDVPEVFDDILPVLREARHAYIFGRFDWSKSKKLRATTELIWDKEQVGPGDLTLPWGPAHEILTFGVHIKSDANAKDGYGRLSAKMRKGSVLRVPRLNSNATGLHQTEKPVALLRILVESSSCFDDVVFDPFMGSGSTLVAAAIEGRGAVGIDLDEANCEKAIKRLAQINLSYDE
jgi:DNA modification methylase